MASGMCTYRRLVTILERQYPPRYGSGYQVATRATKEEAPKKSKATKFFSEHLGRERHALSREELGVNVIVEYAMCNSNTGETPFLLLDVHEQKVIPYGEELHPFASHPKAAGFPLPRVRGSLQVASELHFLKYHPKVTTDQGRRAPFPYLGDCLIFLMDSKGPYCSNLTVKQTAEQFTRPIERRMRKRGDDERTVARHQIEERTYADASIPTHRVTAVDLHPTLVMNLVEILKWYWRADALPERQQQEIISTLNDGLAVGALPLDILLPFANRFRTTFEIVKRVFYKAVWTRRLQVDLYEPLQIDAPMLREVVDPRKQYARWFERRLP